MRLASLTVFSLLAASAAPNVAAAADPVGDWLVQDKSAIIRIANCGGAYWGVVAWEKTPGRDDNNPDPNLKGRPMLGGAILLGLKPTPQQIWEGQIYNPKNGKNYSSKVKLTGANGLRVDGCVMGFLCGGEDWTRAPQSAAAPPPAAKGTTTAKASAAAAPKGGASSSGGVDVCSSVAGRAH